MRALGCFSCCVEPAETTAEKQERAGGSSSGDDTACGRQRWQGSNPEKLPSLGGGHSVSANGRASTGGGAANGAAAAHPLITPSGGRPRPESSSCTNNLASCSRSSGSSSRRGKGDAGESGGGAARNAPAPAAATPAAATQSAPAPAPPGPLTPPAVAAAAAAAPPVLAASAPAAAPRAAVSSPWVQTLTPAEARAAAAQAAWQAGALCGPSGAAGPVCPPPAARNQYVEQWLEGGPMNVADAAAAAAEAAEGALPFGSHQDGPGGYPDVVPFARPLQAPVQLPAASPAPAKPDWVSGASAVCPTCQHVSAQHCLPSLNGAPPPPSPAAAGPGAGPAAWQCTCCQSLNSSSALVQAAAAHSAPPGAAAAAHAHAHMQGHAQQLPSVVPAVVARGAAAGAGPQGDAGLLKQYGKQSAAAMLLQQQQQQQQQQYLQQQQPQFVQYGGGVPQLAPQYLHQQQPPPLYQQPPVLQPQPQVHYAQPPPQQQALYQHPHPHQQPPQQQHQQPPQPPQQEDDASSFGAARPIAVAAHIPPDLLPPSGLWSVSDFRLQRKLYEGSSSMVMRALHITSGRPVVVKVYKRSRLGELQRFQLAREICLHVKTLHPHIIDLYAAWKDAKHVYLLLEWAPGGTLLDLMRRRGGQRLDEAEAARRAARPLLSALAYLHGQELIHRDIKLENVLLGPDGSARLADFGLSIDSSSELPNTRLGTCGYFAPEVLDCPRKRTPFEMKQRGQDGTPPGYSSAVDVWSAGVLLFELLTGRAPFAAPTAQAVVEAIRLRPIVFPDHLSPEAVAFLSALLQRDPAQRATAAALLSHPWVVRHCGPPPATAAAGAPAAAAGGGAAAAGVQRQPAGAGGAGDSRGGARQAQAQGLTAQQQQHQQILLCEEEAVDALQQQLQLNE